MSNEFLVQAIDIAIRLLSKKVFSFLCLILTAIAFFYCLYDPTVLRIVTSSLFGLICLFYQRIDKEKINET